MVSDTKLKGEINTFRYIPMFLKEFLLDMEKKEGRKIIVKREGGEKYTLVKLSSFPWWFFLPNFALCLVVLVIALTSLAKTQAFVEFLVGATVGMAMGFSLLHMDRADKFVRSTMGAFFPLLKMDVVATPLVVGTFLLSYGAIFSMVFKFEFSVSWISFAIESFILTAFLYPFFRYWGNRNRLFLIAEEEGFVVIARSVLKRKTEGSQGQENGEGEG